MKSIRSVDDLIRFTSSGANPKYIFFWGHTPDRNGAITKACFSQWWEAPFEVDGVRYLTAEHYMMGAKARLFDDEQAFGRIVQSAHPKQAKDLGRRVVGFEDVTWNKHRFDIVVAANEAKFRQNQDLGDYLRSTGDRVLVEASPVDTVWGIGLAADSAGATTPEKWKGLNLLGFALMEVRERIGQQQERAKEK